MTRPLWAGVGWLLLVSLVSPGPAVADPDADAGLERLMARLAASPALRARFEERIESPLLAEPVVARGWLAVAPPDRLVRVTETPEPSRLVLAGEALHLQPANGAPIDLGADPMARSFVSEFARLFAGDLPGLRARYDLAFRSEGSGFELQLTPKSGRVKEHLARVVLAGEGDVVQRIELHEAGGGRTTTRLLDVEAGRAFSPAEAAALFGAPGPP